MKKLEVLFNMINNFIIFSPRYCIYNRPLLFPVLTMLTKKTEIIFIATYQDVFLNQILKRDSAEKIDDFLKTLEKMSKTKKQLINTAKRKLNINKSKYKTDPISTLNHSGKEQLLILIQEIKILTLDTKEVNIVIIGANVYCTACKLKKALVFALLMGDLKYQAEKKARLETNRKSFIPEKHYDLLDIFSMKNSDIFLLQQKYDHKLILEKEQKYGHAPLYQMLP